MLSVLEGLELVIMKWFKKDTLREVRNLSEIVMRGFVSKYVHSNLLNPLAMSQASQIIALSITNILINFGHRCKILQTLTR